MNRLEFMDQLEQLLADIPEGERREAIQYYNDYLNDAGVENEEEVLAAFGSPEELAGSIREGLREENADAGEFSETGFLSGGEKKAFMEPRESAAGSYDRYDRYRNNRYQRGQYWNDRYRNGGGGRNAQNADGSAGSRYRGKEAYRQQENAGQEEADGYEAHNRKVRGGLLILLLVLAACAFPVLIPVTIGVGGGVLGGLLGILAGILGLIFGSAAVAIAGVIILGVGIVELFVSPMIGVALTGAGLVMLGVGMLLLWGLGWSVGKGVPALCRIIGNVCRRVFHKGGNQE